MKKFAQFVEAMFMIHWLLIVNCFKFGTPLDQHGKDHWCFVCLIKNKEIRDARTRCIRSWNQC